MALENFSKSLRIRLQPLQALVNAVRCNALGVTSSV